MKRVLYKLPFAGFVLLSLIGCNHKDFDEVGQLPVRDTVTVLKYVHPSMQTGRKMWVADKFGNEFYSDNVSLGTRPDIIPKPGDRVYMERGFNRYGGEYMMVLHNITAQNLMVQHMIQK